MSASRYHEHRALSTHRRGMVLVAVLVVLIVASVMLAAMLRTGRQKHLVLRRQQQRLQAIELGQAGVERAAAQLTEDPSFQQEIWKVPAKELQSRHDAEVAIHIESVDQRPARRRIRVQVNYPPTGPDRIQHSQEAFIDLPEKDTP